MTFPPPMAEFLDMIKERYEGCKLHSVYKIVKSHTIYDCSTSVLCDIEIAYDYDDLCVKMFDLDVSGWEISGEITDEAQNSIIGRGIVYYVVTIRMTRPI